MSSKHIRSPLSLRAKLGRALGGLALFGTTSAMLAVAAVGRPADAQQSSLPFDISSEQAQPFGAKPSRIRCFILPPMGDYESPSRHLFFDGHLLQVFERNEGFEKSGDHVRVLGVAHSAVAGRYGNFIIHNTTVEEVLGALADCAPLVPDRS